MTLFSGFHNYFSNLFFWYNLNTLSYLAANILGIFVSLKKYFIV